MNRLKLATAVASSLAVMTAGPAMAGVFGSLGNFDVVNDTGKTAHGFEIDIEDSSFTKSQISSVFGLDRNFGVPATSVERYGAPTITELPGVGVKITYQASFANGAWSTGTQTGSFSNPGEVCWALGGTNYPNVPCDHFGVATFGNPAKINYNWLLETTPDSSILTPSLVGIPVVNFMQPPPTPAKPNPPVKAVIQAVAEPVEQGQVFGEAYWVKIYTISHDHNVELDQLVGNSPEVPKDPAEIETEWTLFQSGGENEEEASDVAFDGKVNKSIVRRYEFYKYTGQVDLENGEALCDNPNPKDLFCSNNVNGNNGVGDYIGAQMAGFNADQPEPVVVPPPNPETTPEPSPILGLGVVAGIGVLLKGRKRK